MSETTTPAFSDGSTSTEPADRSGEEYEVVRFPDGSLRAVAKASIVQVEAPVTSVSEHVAQVQAQAPDELFYVWLADGTVRKVKESDLPAPAGTNAPHGIWVEAGKTYVIAGVYPVEHPR